MLAEQKYRLGVDIGGTFTDIVMVDDDGQAVIKKVLSTPEDYSQGILNGVGELLSEMNVSPKAVHSIAHATTVATNTVLEGKGARVGLITTLGFRDVLELRRTRIPELYNLDYEKPKPLVPRNLRVEVSERIGANGEVRTPLDIQSARAAIEALRDNGVEAVVIAFINSFTNHDHELKVAELARELLPDDVFITCSHEILPEIREYERTSTTAVNGLLGPVMRNYLNSLVNKLAKVGISKELLVMDSNGGLMSASSAARKPARLLESGPAAGVVAAAKVASEAGFNEIITLDMGGTTVKTTVVENGEPARTTEYEVGAGINLSSKLIQGAGYAVKLPFIDVVEIGAGGGSLAWFDKGGMLQVGPQSAGSTPGPVCYHRGGETATLTDSLLTLGFLGADSLVGGKMSLDAGAAHIALEQQLGARLDRSALEAAHAVFTIAVSNMTRAVKAVSTYRGRDPRDFALFAFGGNGPVVALAVANALEMRRAIIPPSPGVFSAVGLLLADAEHVLAHTLYGLLAEIDKAAIGDTFSRMEAEARQLLAEEGYQEHEIQINRFLDLRYHKQAFELTVPLRNNDFSAVDVSAISHDFHEEHERTYGHKAPQDPVELVNVRISARANRGGSRPLSLRSLAESKAADARVEAHRTIYFGPEHGLLKVPVISRLDLAGSSRKGPFVVSEYDSTCVVHPGWSAVLDERANIQLSLED